MLATILLIASLDSFIPLAWGERYLGEYIQECPEGSGECLDVDLLRQHLIYPGGDYVYICEEFSGFKFDKDDVWNLTLGKWPAPGAWTPADTDICLDGR